MGNFNIVSRVHVADMMWTSADGKERRVADLELNHLVNVLNWINEDDMKYPASFIKHMEKHARDRAFILLADSKPYPYKDVDEKWLIIDETIHKAAPPPQEYIDFIKEKYGVDNPHAIAQAIARKKLDKP